MTLEEWPKDQKSGRYLCSPEHPMPLEYKNERWAHTRVVEEDSMSDYWLYYKCLDCHFAWREEMPD